MCVRVPTYTRVCERRHGFSLVAGCRRSSPGPGSRPPSSGCPSCVGEGSKAGKGLTRSGRARGPVPRLGRHFPLMKTRPPPATIATVLTTAPRDTSLLLLPKSRLGVSTFAALLSFAFGNKREKPSPERERDSLFLPQIA